jgi:hypothetical protein
MCLKAPLCNIDRANESVLFDINKKETYVIINNKIMLTININKHIMNT